MTRWWDRIRVPAFVTYALAVVIATHLPKLRIESGVMDRPDILIHVVVFAGWATMLLLSGLLRGVGPARRAALAWVIAAAYAAVDELTQAIPFVHRTATWEDYAANLAGVTLGCGAWLAAMHWLRRRAGTVVEPPAAVQRDSVRG